MANPSADVYGADLQLLESVAALRERGWRVVVATPSSGPLQMRLTAIGAEVELVPFPVLRRASMTPGAMASLVARSPETLTRLRGVVRRVAPQVVYVNTVTLPWWLVAGRLAGVPVVCHVHEAETRDRATVRRALAAPLALADVTVVNSRTTREMTATAAPYVRHRLRLVRNGVRGPAVAPAPRARSGAFRMVVVGRVSPRKAPDVALEAAALLRTAGLPVRLELCGTPGPGHEEFAQELRRRADRPDLEGAVTFTGYESPIWPALERSDVLVAPSLGESFGNAVVEGQLAERPVVASAVPGHLETVDPGVTGLLVPAQDPAALADAVAGLMEDGDLARRLALAGRSRAEALFGLRRYGDELAAVLDDLAPDEDRPPSALRPGDRRPRPRHARGPRR
jgi:glycosyltransferase involved in cell wall biosynthesis